VKERIERFRKSLQAMIPNSMREPKFMLPLCVVEFVSAMFFLAVLLLPNFAPEMRDLVERRGAIALLYGIVAQGILIPVGTLWFFSRNPEYTEEDEL